MELAAHEVEILRRSLAIGNGLPSDQIQRLLEACNTLLARARAAEQRDEQLRAELDALRPVIAELRQRLTTLNNTLTQPPRS
jgi:DNA-binding transcriptional MerR regulator